MYLKCLHVWKNNSLFSLLIVEPSRTYLLSYYSKGLLDIFDDMPEIYIALMSSITHIITTALTCFMAFRCFKLGFRKTAMHAHLCTVGVSNIGI